MLNQEEIEAFKKFGYSFEEVQSVQKSLKSFQETGISYDKTEAMKYKNF